MWLLITNGYKNSKYSSSESSMFSQCMRTHVFALKNDMGALGECHHKINSKWKPGSHSILCHQDIFYELGCHGGKSSACEDDEENLGGVWVATFGAKLT